MKIKKPEDLERARESIGESKASMARRLNDTPRGTYFKYEGGDRLVRRSGNLPSLVDPAVKWASLSYLLENKNPDEVAANLIQIIKQSGLPQDQIQSIIDSMYMILMTGQTVLDSRILEVFRDEEPDQDDETGF